MKKLYDITFTVELSDKQNERLGREEDAADERDENFPLWDVGLVAMRHLREMYGVKAKLKRWGYRRNREDLNRG